MRQLFPILIAGIAASGPFAHAEDLSTISPDSGSIDAERAEKVFSTQPNYSPYAGRNFPERPLFGDTHLHSSLSFDAGMVGGTVGPEESYRFARGEEILSSTGLKVRLSRPLDFLVVADHSDNLGFSADFQAGASNIVANETGRRWHGMFQDGDIMEMFGEVLTSFGDGSFPEEIRYLPGTPAYRSAWDRIIKAAEDANNPGRFTAFIGYEWTSTANGNNLHRNVIYRDGAARASLMEPMTAEPPFGSPNPRELWKWMEEYERRTAGQLLAIPHNGNVSNGRMFPIIEPGTGVEIDQEYVEARLKWEPIIEVTQIKGDGESHPSLSPDDEFADFETWDKSNVGVTEAKTPEMLEFEYARSALKNGLVVEKKLGSNPFKFGMVGSTDAHGGLAGVEEDGFLGKTASAEPTADRWDHVFLANKDLDIAILNWETSASGYAAVWAHENTRESIFDAMKRREVYATTGSRLALRFFGGWEFSENDAISRSPALAGYRKGVPMGGQLSGAPDGTAPTFLLAALKDPIGANLDRLQIVKGWLNADGSTSEQVFDVVWSDADERPVGADGKVPAVGSTVDVANATWTNSIGAPELVAVWTDPEFDADQSAFYYARVLEIPTPRWTAYDQRFFEIEMSSEVPMEIQERGYSSPIWYTAER